MSPILLRSLRLPLSAPLPLLLVTLSLASAPSAGCKGSTPQRAEEKPAVAAEAEPAETSSVVACAAAGVTCRAGNADPWSWTISDPRYPDARSLATLELGALVVASGQGEAFAVAVHADADTAAGVVAALLAGPDPAAVAASGAWALVQTPDGALHELGEPELLISRALTP